MPKTKISEFSSTPANNTDIDSINISEGCAPSGINDAIRELMAQLKDWQSGTSNDPMVIGSSGSLTLNQGTANGVTYLNGSKVVTSGSALVFDGSNLGINSSVTALTNYRGAEFAGTSTTTGGFLRMRSSDSSINSLDFTDSNGRAIFTTTSHPVRFGTNDTERARIDTSGNLLVGTTSQINAEKFGVSANVANYMAIFKNSGNNANRLGIAIQCGANDASGTNYAMAFDDGDGTRQGQITFSGGTTTYGTSSDYRLKENISPLTGSLNRLALLKPCKWNWKRDGGEAEGFVAHELQDIVPIAVAGEKDAVDEEGNPVYQSVGAANIVPLLVSAIQELKAEFDAYKASHP